MDLRTEAPKPMKYTPRETAQVRTETISKIVSAHNIFTKAAVRTSLYDTDAVKRIVFEYFSKCEEAGIVPNFEGVAAACGVSRKTAYQFLREHPESETTKFLEVVQTALAAIRSAAAEKNAINATFAIFSLLNSNLEYTNKHEIEFSQPPQNPLEISNEDMEAVRKRYLDALPDDD